MLVCVAALHLQAMDRARIFGEIFSRTGNPLQNVQIILEGQQTTTYRTASSGQSGSFIFGALPPDRYILRCLGRDYKPLIHQEIPLGPSQTLRLKITFSKEEDPLPSEITFIRTDYGDIVTQTTQDSDLIHRTPTAHNVWSLVENLDFSATTNRIDVGGLWGAIPALFSSRGGVSWTQTEYYLNGMDVGDPFITGRPLFYPDFYSLYATQLTNAGHPIQTLGPGGAFNLITRQGGDDFHGGASLFFLNSSLQSDNVSARLNDEGIFESHRFNSLYDGNVHLSGPIIPERLNFFASATGFRLNRDMAEFDEDDLSDVLSGLFSLNARLGTSDLNLLWTGQRISHNSYGAERKVPFSSTTDREETYNTLQAVLNTSAADRHFFKFGLSFSQGTFQSRFQEGDVPHGYEIFTKIPVGSAAQSRRDIRTNLNFLFSGESILAGENAPSHGLKYGFQVKYGEASANVDVFQNHHRLFYEGSPVQVALFNTPFQHREASLHIDGFLKDTLTFRSLFSVYLGLHMTYSRGWAPDIPPGTDYQGISWFNLSPRLGITFPLNRDKSAAIKIHVARYFLSLPLGYLTYGHPNAPGALVYRWEDLNSDSLFQDSEASTLLRREGPYFGSIDPNILRPQVDELGISWQKSSKSGWDFMFGLFTRETRNLIETLNTGVPFEAYDPVRIFDTGDDRLFGTHDDLIFTVFDQQPDSLGQDLHFLTNEVGENRLSKYYGADLAVVKRYGEKFTFFLSLTATQADGTTSPGNTEQENDDGIIGSLYDDPNSQINARGRMRFDRAYTGRLGIRYKAPLGITLGCVIKYYDGQPFTRKIIVAGLNQGPFYIQAHPRGVARYEYNRTIEIRIEKAFRFQDGTLRLILDGFNVINRALATEEYEWTSAQFPLRYATEIQSPRIFRLGLSYEF
jgi:hypothetical protein